MSERTLATRIDRYLRREDTILAHAAQKLSSAQGRSYRKGETKRAFEMTLAIPLAIATLPLASALAIAKKLEDGGSCFYIQKRLNQEGKTIGVVKIRCMREDADKDLGANLENAVKFGEDKDPRNTRLGSFMRKFELEELPQLWQIVKGDLSLVDIRSAPKYVFDHLHKECPQWVDKWEEAYYSGKAGVFSLNSAINNRPKDDTRRYHLDMLYARKASLGLDLFILYRTGLRIMDKITSKFF